MQHVQHHDAGKRPIRKRQPVSVSDDVDPWKAHDIGCDDIRPELLDVRSAAADIEDAAVRAAADQLPVEVVVQQPQRGFLFPNRAVFELPLAQALLII